MKKQAPVRMFQFYVLTPKTDGLYILISVNGAPIGTMAVSIEDWDLLEAMLKHGSKFFQDNEAGIEFLGNGKTG